MVAAEMRQPFRLRDGAMAKFGGIKTLRKSASVHAALFVQTSSGTILMAPQGHSTAQMPQPLQ